MSMSPRHGYANETLVFFFNTLKKCGCGLLHSIYSVKFILSFCNPTKKLFLWFYRNILVIIISLISMLVLHHMKKCA